MVFGKNFGGMVQGNNKTGQKGTNSNFVMTHVEIKLHIHKTRNSLMQKSLLIFAHKKRFCIGSKSRLGATSSNSKATYSRNWQIWQRQNYYGAASSAQRAPATCVLMQKNT
jgi:hypothetical protein